MRSYIENTDPRVVSLALRCSFSQMGITLEEHAVRGGTDGARLSELGIPTPNVFNGGYDYHSKFEWNTVQNLETSLIYHKTPDRSLGKRTDPIHQLTQPLSVVTHALL